MSDPTTTTDQSFDPTTAVRPVPALLKYYFFISLLGTIAFPILMLIHFFKYETLRYSFDADGLRMSWGILFRREINLTYRRIQDIHLTRNIIQDGPGHRVGGVTIDDLLYYLARFAAGC